MDTLPSDVSLADALRERGLRKAEVSRVERLVAPHRRRTGYGRALRLVGSPDGGLRALEVVLAPERVLRVFRSDGRAWEREILHVPPVTDTALVTGRLAPEAHYALERWSERPRDPRAAVNRVARRLLVEPELRSGDGYHAIVEREVGTDGSVLGIRVLAIRFQGLAGPVTVLRRPGRHEPGWMDTAGRTLSRSMIPPLAFPRVTSGFDRGRFHPVLKRRVPHLGVDFAGWYSTPVRAAAGGEVTYRGWFGAHGRMVEITHPDGRRTRYSHLLRYRRGLSVGDRVAQGEFMGAVGSSGLSDGPHLHFSLIDDGEYLDPLEGLSSPVRAVEDGGSVAGPTDVPLAGAEGARADVGRDREAGLRPEDARLVALLDEARATVAPGSWALARISERRPPGS